MTVHPVAASRMARTPRRFKRTRAKGGKTETDEVAVMIDTRDALDIAAMPAGVEFDGYVKSWRPARDEAGGRIMKLASLKEGGRDGTLIVVDRDLKRAVRADRHRADPAEGARRLGERRAQARARCARQLRDDKAPARSSSTPTRSRRRCRAPINGPTARPTSSMSSWCARRAAPRCRRASGPIR